MKTGQKASNAVNPCQKTGRLKTRPVFRRTQGHIMYGFPPNSIVGGIPARVFKNIATEKEPI